jgi:type II secretory pathway pseudopilin PulG
MVVIPQITEARRKRGGFTLLEVLLSAVILGGLTILLLAMANRTFTLWGDGEQRRKHQREAQASLRMIGEDLRSAVIIPDDKDSLMIRPEKTGNSLFFLVSHPTERRQPGIKGDLCVSGYFTAPDPLGNGGRNLYRFHASGDEVIQAIQDRSLEKLYDSAAPGKPNTELLARDIAELHLSPVFPNHSGKYPEALYVTVTALNRSDMQKIMGDEADRQSIESLLGKRGTSLSSLITLPPAREVIRTR